MKYKKLKSLASPYLESANKEISPCKNDHENNFKIMANPPNLLETLNKPPIEIDENNINCEVG